VEGETGRGEEIAVLDIVGSLGLNQAPYGWSAENGGEGRSFQLSYYEKRLGSG
jgi:hypothetical protein